MFWLFKSEPHAFSWDDQVAQGAGPWTGVRNYAARNNMRAMGVGDRGFFYHSSTKVPAVVGIVEVVAAARPDPSTEDPRWDCVEVRALRPLGAPVTLAVIRADPRLAAMALVTNSRLSVQPVTEAEWGVICALGGVG